MFRSAKPRAVLSRSVALFAVLAITTGWSAPAQAPTDSIGAFAPAAAASRDVSANTVRVAAWESGWDARAASASLAKTVRNDAPIDTTLSPRRASVQHSGPAPIPAPAKAKPKAPEAAKVYSKPAPTYQGRNHFWIPSLGMSYNVHWYGCSDTFYPGNYIYRWGCAGKNNVYILGHAHSVMKPLHDLYVSGGLRKGMVAIYADAKGRVTKYKVTEWRVVRPTEIAWQIAAQRVPSMTLQTCVWKDSQYRLNVRLVAVN
jgi:sortase (surface protein transpeptidase)